MQVQGLSAACQAAATWPAKVQLPLSVPLRIPVRSSLPLPTAAALLLSAAFLPPVLLPCSSCLPASSPLLLLLLPPCCAVLNSSPTAAIFLLTSRKTVTSMLTMSPSLRARESGMPWQMHSLTEVHTDLGKRP